jgi:RNA recognition motif-containing protein
MEPGVSIGRSMTTIYVGNLPFSATEQDVRAVFEAHGDVRSVALVTDRETGRPCGFGFVEMPDDEAGLAIAAVNGQALQGRPLRVNAAQQRLRQGGGPFRR